MNSYPPELLVQLAPVMFVAGLGTLPSATAPASPAPKAQDPFAVLAARLKEALLAQRKVAVWAPDKSKTFQVVLVEPVSGACPSQLASTSCFNGGMHKLPQLLSQFWDFSLLVWCLVS